MGRHETYVDGQVVEHNDFLDYRTYATYAEVVAAVAGFGFNETGRVYLCTATGMFYYWNGAALVPFPSTGGAGAPSDRSYVTTADEGPLGSNALPGSVMHSTLTNAGGFLHECLLHHVTHEDGGTDEFDVTGLLGKLADPQNAGWLLNHIIDNISIGDGKFAYYDLATNSIKWALIAGGGDMLAAVYDADADNIVESADNADTLDGSHAAAFATVVHVTNHRVAGSDPFIAGDLLDATARVATRKNSGAGVGSRRQFNFLDGTNTTWTISDVPANEEITVRVDASALTGLLPYETTATALGAYTPSTAGANGQAVVVHSTHATDGGEAVFFYSNAAWGYRLIANYGAGAISFVEEW